MEVSNLVVYITNDCNLRCPYCFVNKDKQRMNLKTGKAMIDFLLGQANKTKELSIGFFGGEPLLEFELIKKIVEYSKEKEKKYGKKITFGVTTNGTLFTKEIIDYFWENDFGILFSWDGDKKHIVKVKGIKAYNQMIRSVKLLKKKGFRLHARTTVCPDDLRMVDHVKHIFEIGFEGASLCPMSGTDAWNQKKTDEAYMELADYYIQEAKKNNLLELSYINKDLLVSMELQRPSQGPCGAGKGLFGITADGKILPCQHPETWLPDYVLGNVFERKINEELRRPFLEYRRDDFIGCDKCIARPHCIGACLNVNYDANKNMFKPWEGGCIWTRARYKAVKHVFDALYIKQKNLSLIKWVLKNRTGWVHFPRENIFDANKLDTYKDTEKVKSLSFRIAKQDLNFETGNKIIQFLDKVKESNDGFKMTKPLPPCLFGSKSLEVFKKFNIPKQRWGTLQKLKTPDFMIESCDVGKGLSPQMKKLRELYQYYTKNIELPEKCKSCIYRIRKKCDYAYFGF